MNAEARLTKARTHLLMDQPFLAALLMRLNLKPDAGCVSMWTDGIDIGYNPQFVEAQQLIYLKALLAHETLHCAMQHCSRGMGRDRALWNAACDYAVNPLLIEQGLQLPDNGLVDPRFSGMDAETIYNILENQIQKRKNPNQNQVKPQSPQGQAQPQSPQGQAQPQSPQGQAQPQSPQNQAKGPSQSQQNPAYWGEVRVPKLSPPKMSGMEQGWKQAWAESRMVARKQGCLPASLDRAVTKALRPKIPWREVLANFLTVHAKTDYSFVPNRRYIHQSIYLPSMSNPGMGEVVVALDTSGSVGQKDLDIFAAEIMSLFQQLQPVRGHLLLCDATIQKVIPYDATDGDLKLTIEGGGGTSFAPVFEWTNRNADPVVLVYLTDLRGCFPAETPRYPVLWITPFHDPSVKPPFGDVIEMT